MLDKRKRQCCAERPPIGALHGMQLVRGNENALAKAIVIIAQIALNPDQRIYFKTPTTNTKRYKQLTTTYVRRHRWSMDFSSSTKTFQEFGRIELEMVTSSFRGQRGNWYYRSALAHRRGVQPTRFTRMLNPCPLDPWNFWVEVRTSTHLWVETPRKKVTSATTKVTSATKKITTKSTSARCAIYVMELWFLYCSLALGKRGMC